MVEIITDGLKAYASGIEAGQPAELTAQFYDIISAQLKTEAEKEAFNQGALAISADAENKRLRRLYHTIKFRQALKQLEKGAILLTQK